MARSDLLPGRKNSTADGELLCFDYRCLQLFVEPGWIRFDTLQNP
jgi:hypothetical protein